MAKASLELIYKEVKSVSQRLEFLEELVEEIVVSGLPKTRLRKSQRKELRSRLAEMKCGERVTLDEMKRV
jgi:acyl-coenzyme A synthetase/AMP-(fatty) acid ligase